MGGGGGMKATGKKHQIEVTEKSLFFVVDSLDVLPHHLHTLLAALMLSKDSRG